MTKDVENLIAKAAKAEKSEDAMRFSQAALNAANGLSQVQHTKQMRGDPPEKPDIEAMVTRFLGWELPENFSPDCGISFEPKGNKGNATYEYRRRPAGTNLFTATQAKAMIEYLLGES